MDLRSLINKLDTLDQKQLLKESAEVFEALTGIQYSDVEALARQYPPGKDTERATALAKMAKDNNLPGLFDPFTNKYVNANTGTFARIGAYDAEVTLLKNKGLLPLGATTSNFGMGQDQATAQAGNLSAQEIIKKAYRADQIMDLALPKLSNQLQIAPTAAPAATTAPSTPPAPARESVSLNIANSLMEEFGYSSKEVIAEAIDRAQHQELKKLVADLKPYESSNHQAGQVIVMFASYNRARDQLIREILSLINRVKKRLGRRTPATTTAPAPSSAPAAATSATGQSGTVQESIRINLSESAGDQWLYHSGRRDDNTLTFVNSRTKEFYTVGTVMENIDGAQYMLVEDEKSKKAAQPERGVLQRVDDTIRGVANVWTGGWADNVEAKLNSWVNKTTYGEELKKSLARTDAASKSALIKFNAFGQEWEPSAYDLGQVVGGVTMLPALGWKAAVALLAADYGQEKLIRNPHNEKTVGSSSNATPSNTPGQGGMTDKIPPKGFPYDPKVEEIQKQLKSMGYNLGTFGKNKDGVDGRLGQTTATALEKAKTDGYTMDASGKLVKQAANNASANDGNAGGASASTDSAPAEKPEDVAGTIQLALGVSSTGTLGQADIAAFGEYVKKNGGDPYEALNKIVAGNMAESVMSDIERMSALKSQLIQLDEAGRAGMAIEFLTKLFGKGEAKAAGKEVAGSTDDAVRSTVNRARPDNPNIAGQNPYVQSRSGYGTGSQPTQFAKFENSAIGNLTKAVDDMIRGGKNPATKDIILAAEKGFAERFGFKAGQAFRSAINQGGKVLTFMKNRKWLTAFLLLAAAGYLWNSSTPSEEPGGAGGAGGAGNGSSGQSGMDAEVQEDLDELRQRLQELVDGWPDDAETASALQAAAAVGATPANNPAGSGQGGMQAGTTNNGSSRVLDTSRTTGAAGSSYNAMVAQDTGRNQPK